MDMTLLSRISSAAECGGKYITMPPEEAIPQLGNIIIAQYRRKGLSATSEQVDETARFLDADIRQYFGNTVTLAEVELAIDLGAHGTYGEFRGLNASRMYDYIKAYVWSDERTEYRREKAARQAAAQSSSTPDVGLLNWNAMLEYTRRAYDEWCAGERPVTGATKGQLLSEALGTIRRHNMANAYRWLKAEGLVAMDAGTLATETQAIKEAGALLPDASERQVTDLAFARMLEIYFKAAKASGFDIPAELARLDRETPIADRRFWS